MGGNAQTVAVELQLDVSAPAAARRTVRALLVQWGLDEPDLLATAELLASELVAGAVRARAQREVVQLQVERHDGALRIALVEPVSVVPSQRQADEEEATSRRALLLTRLSTRWGVEPVPGPAGRTRIYAVLSLPEATAS